MSSGNSVALGFAWRAANVGGVRRHLESIERYSKHPIALYPSTHANELLAYGSERNAYQLGLDQSLIERHALFHSHVDPRFIDLSQQAQQQGKPWVHTYHALYFAEDWDGGLAHWQEEINRSLLGEARQADACLAVNSWLVNWLNDVHGIKSSYLPNAVDLDACATAQGNRFINVHGLNHFALFVGAIAGVKNPLAFIELAKRLPRHDFVMAGTGLTPRGISEKLGVNIPPNLRALGPLSHKEALDAIAACGVFVMTSHREGLPTVLLEAMAMAKPCVVPDAPWFDDAIPSPDCGFRYQPGNLDDLEEKIGLALNHGSQELARTRVEEHFSWSVIIPRLDAVYRELLA